MPRIVVIDYEVVGTDADQKIVQLLNGGGLEASLNTRPFSLFPLTSSPGATMPRRKACAFELEASASASEVMGRINSAVESALGRRPNMSPVLPDNYIRLYVSAGDGKAAPEQYSWNATQQKMR